MLVDGARRQGRYPSVVESFSTLLRRGRVATGLSYQRIAELVGRSPATIRNWERARSTPTDPEVVVSLAAVLAISEKDMLSAAGLVANPAAGMFADLVAADLGPEVGEQADDTPGEPGRDATEEPEIDRVLETTDVSPSDPDPVSFVDEALKAAELSPKAEDVVLPQEARPEGGRSDAGQRPPRRTPPAAPRSPITVAATAQSTEPSYLEDVHQLMTYRVRAVLTVVLGIVLLLLLEWGLRGVGTSLKNVLGGFGP